MGDDRYYEAVIFDLNGTLVEIYKVSEYQDNLILIANTLGLEYTRFKDAWAKSYEAFPFGDYADVSDRFKIAFDMYFNGSPYSIEKEKLEKAIQIRYDYIANQALQIRPHVFETLDWLVSQNYKIGLISNCTMETPRAWPKNPLAKYFPKPIFSCEVKVTKPNRRIFELVLQNIGIEKAERCIYVADGDDREFDTALEMGMTPVLITYDTKDAYRHENFPDIENKIETFKELPALINKLENQKQPKKSDKKSAGSIEKILIEKFGLHQMAENACRRVEHEGVAYSVCKYQGKLEIHKLSK
jgi:putative hydrolase of the HAD superfamily